ncbi:hypothetical protein Y1Q_0017832 [Alligator mississippiensis]|uniref:Uncharacterized protein n=1 Tax=Alligator mississippiensis TaxID=8496 RepID=A0A151NL67_ALLMI|nr:hypothetical protein Y1Q_0017832 [Alligator mississippiensis]
MHVSSAYPESLDRDPVERERTFEMGVTPPLTKVLNSLMLPPSLFPHPLQPEATQAESQGSAWMDSAPPTRPRRLAASTSVRSLLDAAALGDTAGLVISQ